MSLAQSKAATLLMRINWVFIGLILISIPQLILGQQSPAEPLPRHLKEAGYPIIQNYSPDEYDAFDQNWDFVQDSTGVLFVANGDGILTYNGVHWDLLSLPNNGSVFSLEKDNHGRIYVGAHNELGYLQADSHGRLIYTSLLPRLDEDHHDFNIIRKVLTTDEGIYFSSREKLFRWDGNKFTIWENSHSIGQAAYQVNGSTLLFRHGVGLMQLKNDQFELVPQGERFADGIQFILSLDERKYLIGTSNELYIRSDSTFTQLSTDRPDFFKANKLYCGALLMDSTLALGSLSKGILIIDQQGRQRSILSQEGLLQSNQILSLYSDQSGILWAALNSGIAKIEYPSPFSIYDKASQISGSILKILRYNNGIHVGTSSGLFVLDPNDRDAVLTQHPDVNRFVFDMIIVEGRLIVGSEDGVHEIDNRGKTKLILNNPVQCIQRSKLDTNRVYVGITDGLVALYYSQEQWAVERTFEDVSFAVHTIVETLNGDLWLRTNASTIARISFDDPNAKYLLNPKLTIFEKKHGLPGDVGIPHLIEGNLYVVTNDSIHLFESDSQRFTNDTSLYKKLGLSDSKVRINHADRQGNIWFTEYRKDQKFDQIIGLKQLDGNYRLHRLQESRIMQLRRSNDFYAELIDSIIWYLGTPGIVRHDISKQPLQTKLNPKILVSEVTYNSDSLLFAGHGNSRNSSLPFKNNSFRFQFASPGFYQEDANQYQFYLQGFDEDWSLWTSETQKDYTNIPEGDYIFKVRVLNIFGQTSPEATYAFTILPPWHRTWWAYISYALMTMGFMLLIIRWRSRQLRYEKETLAATIEQRTEEIRQKNRLLKVQTEKLKEVDHMKSRLFANISHEFRTPLTLIKGPIDQLEVASDKQLSLANIKMIRRNTDRLLRLVNQLLDLSKLDARSLKLEPAEGNTFKCLRAAASSFSSHAAQRNLDYQIKIPSRLLWTSFDRDKLEKVVYNLLSNAFKFTADDGTVIIDADHSHENLTIAIRDTGKGIPDQKLDYIFDRFYQVDDSYTRDQEGSGIGLALTKELINLMGGQIQVTSEVGQGSEFTVTLPLQEIKTSTSKVSHITEKTGVNGNGEGAVDAVSPEVIIQSPETPTILIAEDNADMRDYIGEQFKTYYRILEAKNGRDGLEQATRLIPDLIITDLMMPQMDGTEMCKLLKSDERTSHIPVIMLTAKAGLDNKIEGLETGADDYLIKPFEAKELQVRVKNLVTQRQQLRELFSGGITMDPKQITVTSLDQRFLQKTLDLLEEHYADGEFGVPQMQEALALSKTQLHRKIKALTNHPPGELLRNFRLKRAAQILDKKGENVTQVAYAVGFNNLSYFAKCFKELHGKSPSDYLSEYKK